MSLDCDRYYDGGIIAGELSTRQYWQREREQALEHLNGELSDAKECLQQAAQGLVNALEWERTALLTHCLTEVRAHLLVADRQSVAEDDQLIMGHVRAACAHAGFALSILEGRANEQST